MRKSKSVSNIQYSSGLNSETESQNSEDQHKNNKWICCCLGNKPSSCCTAQIKSLNIDKKKESETSSSSLSGSLSDISTFSKDQQVENWIYDNPSNHKKKSSKIKPRKHKKRESLGNVSSLSSSFSDISTLSKANFHVKTGLTTSTQLSIR